MDTLSGHAENRLPSPAATRPRRSRRFARATTDELRGDVDALYAWIREATLKGWHARFDEVDRDDARALFSFTGPQYTPEQTAAAFDDAYRCVGPHLVYGTTVLVYVSIVNELAARDVDVTLYRSRLHLCLVHPAPTEDAPDPAPASPPARPPPARASPDVSSRRQGRTGCLTSPQGVGDRPPRAAGAPEAPHA